MNDLNVAIVGTGGIFHHLEQVGMAGFLVEVSWRYQNHIFDGTSGERSQAHE